MTFSELEKLEAAKEENQKFFALGYKIHIVHGNGFVEWIKNKPGLKRVYMKLSVNGVDQKIPSNKIIHSFLKDVDTQRPYYETCAYIAETWEIYEAKRPFKIKVNK